MFGKKKQLKKALVVEDDALLSRVLSTYLADSGFNVQVVANGLEALGMAKTFKPNVILLDLILPPGIDGFAVLKQLKDEATTKNIPVVVVSNLGDVADVKSVKALGADGYFIKANTRLEDIVKFAEKLIKR